jgi:spore maturation protein A
MMNWLWAAMMLGSVACAAATGRLDSLLGASMDGAAAAVQLFIKLLAVYTLWCGVMEIISDSGLADKVARVLRSPLKWLYPSVPYDSYAARQISINMAANMLGVGNAATPAGLEAIKEMKALSKAGDIATDDMCMLLVINCSSIQMLPTTVIALRQAAGSISPADIILPSLIASVCATSLGILAAKAMASFRQAGGRGG